MGRGTVKTAYLGYFVNAGLERLGRSGGLGVALLTGTAAFYFSALQPAQEDLEVLQRRLERAERFQPAASAPRPANAASQMEQFMQFFPPLESAPKWLAAVYSVAERERLELLQGTYKLSEDPALALAHYRVALPVRGSYTQIRRFVAGVLDAVPVASLEGIAFQREKVSEGRVEAKVTLALHLQVAPHATRRATSAQIARVAAAAPGDE